jgi:ABC-type sulfate/molybdate transport systems ATPase subunit
MRKCSSSTAISIRSLNGDALGSFIGTGAPIPTAYSPRWCLRYDVERGAADALFVAHNIEEAILLGDRIVIMTARPGRIKEIVPVNLPRPRDVTSAEFNETRRRIALQLETEVQATFAANATGERSLK